MVKGGSITPEFRRSDNIFVDPAAAPQPGDLVVAKLDNEDEATFKKYWPRGSDAKGSPIIDLVPLNEDWPPLRIDAEHPGHIIGTVIEHRRFLRR